MFEQSQNPFGISASEEVVTVCDLLPHPFELTCGQSFFIAVLIIVASGIKRMFVVSVGSPAAFIDVVVIIIVVVFIIVI